MLNNEMTKGEEMRVINEHTGTIRCCFSLMEPHFGSDSNRIRKQIARIFAESIWHCFLKGERNLFWLWLRLQLPH